MGDGIELAQAKGQGERHRLDGRRRKLEGEFVSNNVPSGPAEDRAPRLNTSCYEARTWDDRLRSLLNASSAIPIQKKKKKKNTMATRFVERRLEFQTPFLPSYQHPLRVTRGTWSPNLGKTFRSKATKNLWTRNQTPLMRGREKEA